MKHRVTKHMLRLRLARIRKKAQVLSTWFSGADDILDLTILPGMKNPGHGGTKENLAAKVKS